MAGKKKKKIKFDNLIFLCKNNNMIKEKYLEQIKEKVSEFNKNKGYKFFIFGSSLNQDHFGDLDIGVIGNINNKDLINLKEEFAESNLPYFVDIINFSKISEKFKNNVLNNKVLWLIP